MRARLWSPQAVWGMPQLCDALPGRMHCGQRPAGVQVCTCALNCSDDKSASAVNALYLACGETCLLYGHFLHQACG